MVNGKVTITVVFISIFHCRNFVTEYFDCMGCFVCSVLLTLCIIMAIFAFNEVHNEGADAVCLCKTAVISISVLETL